ncbi:hypothetical protein [Paenibacillus sp. Mc5Re-14]|uniref:hypothetical protein n=1 Tax=Paenibacillus sp. Mc5Re-14 TaxID=1030529 RepID=UPI000A6EF653|nr:hypothetical protein [Paenibacillus sp. Mc5Re-14]
MNEKMKEHIDFVLFEIQNNIEKAKKSGALSGEENELALVRAVTKITVDNLPLTREGKEIFDNLKHFI